MLSPRGSKRKDQGTNVKKSFPTHSIWEGDGKEIHIHINGLSFKFCWYAFVDQATTLIVGSNIQKTESAKAFLEALKSGRDNADLYAMGILIDNRIEDHDLSTVHEFCKEHGITILRTFPGNSKSNGYIENNFSIFQRFVGSIKIDGIDSEALAKSIAAAFVEVFTQQRNHANRKSLGGASPSDQANSALRPLGVEEALKKLQRRFEREIFDIELKWHLIESASKHFEDQTAETIQKFKKILSSFYQSDIVAAQCAYLARVKAKPDHQYRSEYFMAILRNIEETREKAAYSEAFRASVELKAQLEAKAGLDPYYDVEETSDTFLEVIKELDEQPSNSHVLLTLDTLATWHLRYGYKKCLPSLWSSIDKKCRDSRNITSRRWQQVSTYLHNKIGDPLFIKPER